MALEIVKEGESWMIAEGFRLVQIRLCPCCRQAFATKAAAERVVDWIERGRITSDDCRLVERVARRMLQARDAA